MNFIYHHLGLGDSIICNGMVRYLSNKIGGVSIFSKDHNYETVKFMYRDDKNINVIPVKGSDAEVMKYLTDIHPPYKEPFIKKTIKSGFENLWANASNPNSHSYSPSPGFDKRFYEIIGLGFNIRWDNFKVIRDPDREKNLFDKLGLKEKEYIFLHDDNRFRIDRSKIPSNIQVVTPIVGLTPNIFDYCLIIEKALEVHTIESSFQFMIDSLGLNENNYVHRYSRFLTEGEKPVYRTVKKIIT